MDSSSTAPDTEPEAEFSGPSSSPCSAALIVRGGTDDPPRTPHEAATPPTPLPPPSRYESQKRRDWNTFLQYLRNQRPPLALSGCCGAHVIEFLRYLDQFGKTKVHAVGCAFFGRPSPPAPCACPLRQAWGSLDALIGRLRAAYEESGGMPEANPFAARAVRLYLREVRESQAKARGVRYENKKRKRGPPASATGGGAGESSATPPPPPSSSSSEVVGGRGSSAAEEASDAPTASTP